MLVVEHSLILPKRVLDLQYRGLKRHTVYIRTSFIISLLFCFCTQAKAQSSPVEITNVTRYHFRVTNVTDGKLDIYLGQEAGTSGLKKSFSLQAGGSEVLLKSKYRRGTVLQILNSAYEPLFLWDYVVSGGTKLTPSVEFGFGGPGYKSSLSEFWKGLGNNFQYAFHVSFSPFPEIRLGKKSFSRVYVSLDYEMYSHMLDVDNDAHLSGEYVKSSTQESYVLLNQEFVSVNLKYYNVGAYHRFFFLPSVFLDFGIKMPVLRNSFVDLRNDDNVIPNRVTSPSSEPTNPKIRNKATFGNEIFEDLIYFTKIGIFRKNKDPYSPVITDINIAVSFQVMSTRLMTDANFPVLFDNPNTPSADLVPVPTDRGSNLYYMAMVHLTVPIARK